MISSSYRNRLAREAAAAPVPPAPEPDFIVTGTITPDATGNYFDAGVMNGQPYYSRDDLAYHIWYHFQMPPGLHFWEIDTVLGGTGPARWYKATGPFESAAGPYLPAGTATGTATVATPP